MKKNSILMNVLMICIIMILLYMLYSLVNQLSVISNINMESEMNKLDKVRLINNEKLNRDTIKISIMDEVGSINAGQYITNRDGYFIENP